MSQKILYHNAINSFTIYQWLSFNFHLKLFHFRFLRSLPILSPAHYLEKESQQCQWWVRALIIDLFVRSGLPQYSDGEEERWEVRGERWEVRTEDVHLSLQEPTLPPLWSPGSRGSRQARPQGRRWFILIFAAPYFLIVNKTNLRSLSNISVLSKYFPTDEVSLSSSVEPSANNRTKTGSNILLYNRVPKCGSTFLKQLLRKLGKIFNI